MCIYIKGIRKKWMVGKVKSVLTSASNDCIFSIKFCSIVLNS